MITPARLVEQARTYLGADYKHHGRNRSTGVDCVGLVIAACNDLGLSPSYHLNYKATPDPDTLLEGILDNCEKTPGISLDVGNIALMEFSRWAGATHVALITDRGIIHSYERRKFVTEHRLSDDWRRKIKATFRINGVNYG